MDLKPARILKIATALAMIILLLGCTGKETKQNIENTKPDGQITYIEKAPDISDCERMSDINRAKDLCITKVALSENNPAICDTNSNYKYECQAQVFAKLDKCKGLSPPAMSASCFNYMAVQQKNPKICERIQEIGLNGWEQFRDFCIEEYYGEFSSNPAIPYAEKARTEEICEKLISEKAKGLCYLKVFEEALSDSNAALCEKIPDTIDGSKKIENDCWRQGGSENACSVLASKKSLRTGCYWELAAKQANKELCEKLQDLQEKNYCLTVSDKGKFP